MSDKKEFFLRFIQNENSVITMSNENGVNDAKPFTIVECIGLLEIAKNEFIRKASIKEND